MIARKAVLEESKKISKNTNEAIINVIKWSNFLFSLTDNIIRKGSLNISPTESIFLLPNKPSRLFTNLY
tara:strand:+ start:168 stop:374 length:207 start_codon:yes stop_codon:yes gene_type:complete